MRIKKRVLRGQVCTSADCPAEMFGCESVFSFTFPPGISEH
jgi:hypothetical protein